MVVLLTSSKTESEFVGLKCNCCERLDLRDFALSNELVESAGRERPAYARLPISCFKT